MSDEIFDKFGNDPIALCQSWYDEAETLEPNDPEAITLATATPDGKPSLRWVLIKEISARGFKFHTNAESRKGQEISKNPHAAMCFYWKSTRKQIRIEGVIEEVSQEEADEYFSARRTERQIGAWASKQSTPFEKREELEATVEKYTAKFSGVDDIPRPDYWRGFRLVPSSVEFWISNRDRLHERFVYTKQENGTWAATWLCP